MVHSSELSWLHISHPSDVVSVGDEITVYVKSFDRDAKRISLGYKTEETNPWNIFMSQYTIGDVANVKIVSILAFGAFAEIVPALTDLFMFRRYRSIRLHLLPMYFRLDRRLMQRLLTLIMIITKSVFLSVHCLRMTKKILILIMQKKTILWKNSNLATFIIAYMYL